MSKLIRITLLLFAFAAQSVTAASMHCAMDMNNMSMGTSGSEMTEAHSDTNMHAQMDHAQMNHTQIDHSMHKQFENADDNNDASKQLDCCESLADCPMGTCSSPALNNAVELDIAQNAFHLILAESVQQTQSPLSNLYRPPILA